MAPRTCFGALRLRYILAGLIVPTTLIVFLAGAALAQNARLLVVTALALSILAGFGFESLMQLLRQGIDPQRLRKTLARIACVVA